MIKPKSIRYVDYAEVLPNGEKGSWKRLRLYTYRVTWKQYLKIRRSKHYVLEL